MLIEGTRCQLGKYLIAAAAAALLLSSCAPRPKDYWFKEDSVPVSGIKGAPPMPSGGNGSNGPGDQGGQP